MNPDEPFKYISLFAGIGGFEQGIGKRGKCVFASEIDKYARQTYEANHGTKPHGDITKIPADQIPIHDLLCAGFPCQAFSIAGKSKGFADPRGTLFWEILRVIDYHYTPTLLLENVPRLLTHDSGKTWATIKHELEVRGYKVYHQILNAVDFGVPQSRKRIFIVAKLDDEPFMFPVGKSKLKCVADVMEDEVDSKYFLSNRALKGIKAHRARSDTLVKPHKIGLLTDKHTMSNRVYDSDAIAICLDTTNSAKYTIPQRIANLNKGGQGNRVYSTKGSAVCLSALGGGQGAKTGLYADTTGIRRLTPRECARLQGFPESFKLPCSDTQSYKQLGNSVCVKVVRAIVRRVK